MLNIEITISTTDEPHILDIAQETAKRLGLQVKRGYQAVVVTLAETHELQDFAIVVHTAALQAE